MDRSGLTTGEVQARSGPGNPLAGQLGRLPFVAWGLGLFALKVLIDTLVATRLLHRPWSLRYYLSHEQVALAAAGSQADRLFFAVMLLVALPFVCVGLVLTIRRLRSAGLPLWLAILFFFPLLHVLFFALLAVAPPRGHAEPDPAAGRPISRIGRYIPRSRWASSGAALGLTVILGLALTGFNVYGLGVYGLGLFVGLPFCLGLIAVVIHGFHGIAGGWSAAGIAVACVMAVGVGMFAAALEGAVCLVMAAPIWIVLAALGGAVGLTILRHARDQREAALIAGVLALALPALMGAERVVAEEEPLFAVRSEVTINAPADRVWGHVIEFPPLSPPTEWYFRAGVAYPTHAVIDGQGVGAERRCVFSTGAFVEPIEAWEEARLLAFRVEENPPPMRELSFFEGVEPPHLHGFFTARRGELRLTRLRDAQTRLEGTTWYQHHMRPALYWKLWSDALIHRIHLRVLEHIRNRAEEPDHDGS